MLLHFYNKHVKEFLTLALIVGAVVYVLCQPSTVPQLEQSESARSKEHASMRNAPRATTANNVGPTPTPGDGSLANRWKP